MMDKKMGSTVPQGALLRIRTEFGSLSSAERAVCDVIKANPEAVIEMSLADLASTAGVSDTTALRFSRALGFKGFNDLKMAIVADLAAPAISSIFEEIQEGDNVVDIARKVIQSNIQLLRDTIQILDGDSLESAAQLLSNAERIFIFALGGSVPLALEMQNLLTRLGLNVDAFTEGYSQLMKATSLSDKDVIVAISRSGMPKTLYFAVDEGQRRGAKTISLTCDPSSTIARLSDINLVGISSEFISEAVASRISIGTLIHALYAVLALADKSETAEREDAIRDLLRRHRGGVVDLKDK